MGVWDFSIIPKYFWTFLPFAWMTVQITVYGLLNGLALGLAFSLLRISKFRVLTYPARFYIWVIRVTPMLQQLIFLYFGFTNLFVIDKIPAAALALGIHNGAYIAEISRGV